jgi:hypothetical protein
MHGRHFLAKMVLAQAKPTMSPAGKAVLAKAIIMQVGLNWAIERALGSADTGKN